MKMSCLFAVLAMAAASALAQTPKLSDWPGLLDKNKVAEAKALCERFAASTTLAEQVEAQKCLANVALSGNSQIMLEGDDAGGGNIRGSYKPEAVDEALKHLNIGIQLAPQDLSIHQGRLHVLEASGRYDDMIKAADESASMYKGADALQAWLAYAAELYNLRQFQAGLDYMKVIEKHFPDSPDTIGNVGAFLSVLKRDDEAIPYLKRSVAMAPNDPINAWDLARAYDFTNQDALAGEWYTKALALMSDPGQLKESRCLYGEFVEKKLKDRTRACKLQKKNCEPEKQTACGERPADSKTQ